MTPYRRVVITGIGAVSPLGNTIRENWENLLAGKSGIGALTRFDATGFRCRIGGEVKNLNADELLGPKEAKRLDLFCHFAAAAADEAVRQAGLDGGDHGVLSVLP